MNELEQIANDWHEGKSMRVLKLGHSRDFRQLLAYECAFRLIAAFTSESYRETLPGPVSHPEVETLVREVAPELELTEEETGAAVSLAWSALRNGWAKALAGHPEHQYITLTREAFAA
jgi:hypothetical protein